MKILVLNGSPRPKVNTKMMVNALKDGAMTSGHQVEVVDVCRKKIGGCLACEYCHTKENGICVQKDDMQEIYALSEQTSTLKKSGNDFKLWRCGNVRRRIIFLQW